MVMLHSSSFRITNFRNGINGNERENVWERERETENSKLNYGKSCLNMI